MSALLITGSHRSGTTWVGKMLAQHPEYVYLFEPFNASVTLDLAHERPNRWYTYAPDDEARVRRIMNRVTSLQYPFGQALRDASRPRAYKRAVQRALRYTRLRLQDRTPLIKDPIALLSSEWLAKHYDLDVVVLIRHPAAFAGSLKKKGWTFPFQDLLDQPTLMRDHLAPFKNRIREFAQTEKDVVDQAALLWLILYTFVRDCRDRHSDWCFVRHEDLARDPLEAYGDLCDRIGIAYTDAMRRAVEAHSSSQNDAAGSDVKRDSEAVIYNWTQRLSEAEVERVYDVTAPVAASFYSEADWTPHPA